MWKYFIFVCLFGFSTCARLAEFNVFGEEAGDKRLTNEDDVATDEIFLNYPFRFYGQTYFSLFINSNGLLSFLTEIPYFYNSPFPLDYPSVAPFYSDVDISSGGNVWYRETNDPFIKSRVSEEITEYFPEFVGFEAQSVFIITWDGVSGFKLRGDKKNSYQVVLVTGSEDSFVILRYLDNGLQWLQGKGKTSGLPDAIAQAGLIAQDGRFFSLKGSGTDQVRNLDRWSNTGREGIYAFRVGNIAAGDNIDFPVVHMRESLLDGSVNETTMPVFCETGSINCHSKSDCIDYATGFCCQCSRNYYGNGINCIKTEKPLRVTGKVTGTLNGINIKGADLHAYVLSNEGRTYTAISRIDKSIGYDLQSLVSIGEGIAWLFALPQNGVKNGFMMTGGVFNRTVEFTFPQTGHKAYVHQMFQGLDVFGNIAVTTTIKGSIPSVPVGSEVQIDAFKEEITKVENGKLRARSNRSFRLKDQSLSTPFSVENIIDFNECIHEPTDPEMETLRFKISDGILIRYDENEAIVRFSFLSKMSTLEEVDPCIAGKDECGPNSQCIVDGDTFRCVCEQGYDYVFDSLLNLAVCLDMNECELSRDRCDPEAVCSNKPGGYNCECRPGFVGNGFYCEPEISCKSAGCDINAACEIVGGQPRCTCFSGYIGNGYSCHPQAIFGPSGESSCETAGCHEKAHCEMMDGLAHCFCLPGFFGDGYSCQAQSVYGPSGESSCETAGCHEKADCEMVNGLTQCFCLPGFFGDGYSCQAQSVYENCHITQDCSPHAICVPTESGFACKCLEGYAGDGYYCYQSSEDTLPTVAPPSPPTVVQVEIPNGGQFSEEVLPECVVDDVCWCPEGYIFDRTTKKCLLNSFNVQIEFGRPKPLCSDQGCACPEGFIYNELYLECDALEQAPSSNPLPQCDENNNCACPLGYQFELSTNSCAVVSDQYPIAVPRPLQDECNSTGDCNPNAQCLFDGFSQIFVCRCNSGFDGDGKSCMQVADNSCNTQDICDSNAECVYDSYTASYYCECKAGYRGDGYQCEMEKVGCDVTNNCAVYAQCVYETNVGGYECRCNDGFEGDGKVCRAIHTCLQDPGMCHSMANCELNLALNMYACRCQDGYLGDGFNCEASDNVEKDILLLSRGLSILRMPINQAEGTGYPIHVDQFMTAVGADIDCTAGRFYWTDIDSKSIRSSKYDGSEKRPLLTGGSIGFPEDVAVDWVARNVFWTDSKNKVISVINIENGLQRTVIEDSLHNPRGIAVHPGLGLLFWSDWDRNDPKIESSGMDGSNRHKLISGVNDVLLPNSLSVDFETGMICWADAGTHKLECISMDGYGRRKTVAKNLLYPFGLTLHYRSFYYTDWKDKLIHEINKYSGEETSTRQPPLGGSGKLYGIAAVPDRCPPVGNVCQVNRGNCDENQICLPNGAGGRTCSCTDRSISENTCRDFSF